MCKMPDANYERHSFIYYLVIKYLLNSTFQAQNSKQDKVAALTELAF